MITEPDITAVLTAIYNQDPIAVSLNGLLATYLDDTKLKKDDRLTQAGVIKTLPDVLVKLNAHIQAITSLSNLTEKNQKYYKMSFAVLAAVQEKCDLDVEQSKALKALTKKLKSSMLALLDESDVKENHFKNLLHPSLYSNLILNKDESNIFWQLMQKVKANKTLQNTLYLNVMVEYILTNQRLFSHPILSVSKMQTSLLSEDASIESSSEEGGGGEEEAEFSIEKFLIDDDSIFNAHLGGVFFAMQYVNAQTPTENFENFLATLWNKVRVLDEMDKTIALDKPGPKSYKSYLEIALQKAFSLMRNENNKTALASVLFKYVLKIPAIDLFTRYKKALRLICDHLDPETFSEKCNELSQNPKNKEKVNLLGALLYVTPKAKLTEDAYRKLSGLGSLTPVPIKQALREVFQKSPALNFARPQTSLLAILSSYPEKSLGHAKGAKAINTLGQARKECALACVLFQPRKESLPSLSNSPTRNVDKLANYPVRCYPALYPTVKAWPHPQDKSKREESDSLWSQYQKAHP